MNCKYEITPNVEENSSNNHEQSAAVCVIKITNNKKTHLNVFMKLIKNPCVYSEWKYRVLYSEGRESVARCRSMDSSNIDQLLLPLSTRQLLNTQTHIIGERSAYKFNKEWLIAWKWDIIRVVI